MTTTESVASGRTIELAISGMTCASCAARIERKLNKQAGVTATVNFATERATVTSTADISIDELADIIRAAGYQVVLPTRRSTSAASNTDTAHSAELRLRFTVAAILGVPVIVLAMVPMLQFPAWQWASLALASTVVWVCGWPFHRTALVNLRHGMTTMDTLVSLGVTVSYLWSVYALVFGGAGVIGMRHEFDISLMATNTAQSYLEVSAGVVIFLLLGRWLEARAKHRAGAAVRALVGLAAKNAIVLRSGVEQSIPIEDLAVGDTFVVRPGQKIAADGVVSAGRSAVDRSTFTGESMPEEVGAGDQVIGGTVNVGGRLLVVATKVGSETQLAQLTKLVDQAQSGKAKAQRLADRVSAVFVPLVCGLAAVTGIGWLLAGQPLGFAITAAVAVLVIACPCALGLATPTALLVGSGRGAQLGLLLKGAAVLESTRQVNTVVLDKTGTVTTGQLNVVDVLAAPRVEKARVLQLAAAVEVASEHPIGAAIVRAAGLQSAPRDGQLPDVVDFVSKDGLGVTGVVDGHQVVVGQPLLFKDLAIPLAEGLVLPEQQDQTVVWVGWDGEVYGLLTVTDTVRPDAATAVSWLRRLGLRPMLLTGDHLGAATSVASEIGIAAKDVVAGVLPEGKAEVLRNLRLSGGIVAMVGDGVNDAAALATADLGIAMGSGTDIAIESSDLTLLRNDLLGVVNAIRLARRMSGVIRGNLFWAFAYNLAGIPLAASGLLNPMLAGAAMAFSSVFVVGNSLRLRGFQPVTR